MDITSASLALRSLERRGAAAEQVARAEALCAALAGGGAAAAEQHAALADLLADGQWECRAAGLLAAADLLRGEADPAAVQGATRDLASEAVKANLEDREPRVRSCVVKLLEQLARLDGPGTWDRFGVLLCDIVDKSFNLDETERAQTHSELAAQEAQREAARTSIPTLVHETVGWKALETSMRGLESLIRGYGPGFVADGHLDWRDGYLLDLVAKRSLHHENRYVRETGYDVCAVIAAVVCGESKGHHNAHTDLLAASLKRGLQDNWSQVRFAASVATRNLVVGLLPEERGAYLPELVPRMCLNRYYLAEGVRLYSQETWKQAFPGERGVSVVSDQIDAVVAYYCEQSHADNHGVREAACHCIAELSAKVPREVLADRVDTLISALLDCFRDESWPVRDAACVATGRFVRNFSTESEPFAEDLYKLWFDHLSDNIWSVREDSAVALGDAIQAYPKDGLERVLAALPELLAKLEIPDTAEQKNAAAHVEDGAPPPPPPASQRRMSSGDSVPRNVVRGSLNDLHNHPERDAEHSNQQMFSCGSLAPKLKRRGVGCMDHGHSRPRLNWEYTDGGIYLVRELAKLHPTEAEAFMPALGKICTSSFATLDLFVTLWKQLVPIGKALGKRPFKRYFEPFLPTMIAHLSHENQLVSNAAADCLVFIAGFIGQGILRGRIEGMMDGDRLWQAVESSPLVSAAMQ